MSEETEITVEVHVSPIEAIIESVRMIKDDNDPKLVITVCLGAAVLGPLGTIVLLAADNLVTGKAGYAVALRKVYAQVKESE